MKKILVTGAEGYIGSHLIRMLAEHGGYDITCMDIRFHGEYNDISNYVSDESFALFDDITGRIIYDHYDAIVHLAGRSVVPQSLKEPSEYYRINTMGTENLLKYTDHNHFIFASTSSAFEMASPYARSKVGAEDIIKEYSDEYTIFRFFNVSGSDGTNRQLGLPSHLIRRAAMAAAGLLPEIEIFGNDYDTPDGTCVRDYIHVLDVCDAILNALDAGPTNTPYECLGSRKGYSVSKVLDTMQQVTGKKIPIKTSGRRPGDAVSCIVDELSRHCNLTRTLEDMCLDQYNLEINNIKKH